MRPPLAVPQFHTCPPDLHAALRALDARADLVYAGAGQWWLGVTHPSDTPAHAAQRRSGIAMLDGMAQLDGLRGGKGRLAAQVLRALCKLQGWEWLDAFQFEHGPDQRVVDDLRERVWVRQHKADEAWEAMLRETSGEAAAARTRERIAEYARAEAPSVHRHVYRKPVSVLNAGLPA